MAKKPLLLVALLSSCTANVGTGVDSGTTPDSGTILDSGANSSDSGGPSDAGRRPSDGGSGDGGSTLASRYPCDRGIASDPSVVWTENFEEGSVAAFTALYDEHQNPAGMSLVADVPAKSCGKASLLLVSGVNANATDFYKQLPDQDELYVRWYAKYQPLVQWHHTGVWFGGYNPPLLYPYPRAGLQPDGGDLISVSIEPIYGNGTASVRYDTYNYWMQMHSWMSVPMGDTAYYGNAVINQAGFTEDDGQWTCLEVHVKLNTDLASSTGAVLEVWKNDVLVEHFDDQAPVGCWIKDKFCTEGTDGPECTDYPNLCLQPYVPLDLQWRATATLRLNYFWPQNYITSGPDGGVQFDDMVVATQRIGCLQ
jgi:hypothetical protein